MLTVEAVSKGYGEGRQRHQLFEGLDLGVGNGEVVALLGASGSGKTTLLNLVSGIDDPDTGRILVNGSDIHALGEPARTLFRRHHIGFVFQFFNLIPTLTVGENVALPLELTETPPLEVARRVDELLSSVGLNGMADRYPETLSGGEQQRTAVARALAHRPKLLLADEPTGNLDPETSGRVFDMLMEVVRATGLAALIATHNQDLAGRMDRIVKLGGGRLVG